MESACPSDTAPMDWQARVRPCAGSQRGTDRHWRARATSGAQTATCPAAPSRPTSSAAALCLASSSAAIRTAAASDVSCSPAHARYSADDPTSSELAQSVSTSWTHPASSSSTRRLDTAEAVSAHKSSDPEESPSSQTAMPSAAVIRQMDQAEFRVREEDLWVDIHALQGAVVALSNGEAAAPGTAWIPRDAADGARDPTAAGEPPPHTPSPSAPLPSQVTLDGVVTGTTSGTYGRIPAGNCALSVLLQDIGQLLRSARAAHRGSHDSAERRPALGLELGLPPASAHDASQPLPPRSSQLS